jgi:hypothetical protein
MSLPTPAPVQVPAWDTRVAPPTLLPQHQALLTASAIDAATASARGYRSVVDPADLTALGFSEAQHRVPALLVPVWGVNGKIVTYQLRPDLPRQDARGRAVKYETPTGSRLLLDVPRSLNGTLANPRVPLYITEGARKADSAVSHGLCGVALLGVWGWRGTNEHGGKTALADWDAVALNGREVYIVFDSDLATKPEVQASLRRFAAFLGKRDAIVRVVTLPPGVDGSKVGLDDFLVAGHSEVELQALAAPLSESPAVVEPVSEPDPGNGLVFERASDLLAQPDVTQEWIVEHQLPVGGLGLLVGYPKSGKSVTAQNLALAVARGEDFLGRFPTTPGAVFYIAHEEHRDQTRRRWREMGATTEPVYFAFAPHLRDGLTKLQAAVARAPERPVLVIVDPLFKFVHVKDVNDYAQVTAALAPLMAFTRETGLAILALHHTGKGSREVGQEALGSTGIIGGVDMMWVQRRHTTDAGEELYRTLRCTEQRYGHTFPELVLSFDPDTSALSVAGTRSETEEGRAAARILAALERQPEGMLRPEIEEVAGVRTRVVRDLLRGMVERGEVRAEVQPGSARAKRYYRGAFTQVRGGGPPASAEREQATPGRSSALSLPACSPPSVPTGNNRPDALFTLVQTGSPLVPAGVPTPEQARGPEQATEAA